MDAITVGESNTSPFDQIKQEEPNPSLPVTYHPNFLTIEEANNLYQHCLQLQWQQNHIKMVGKILPVPRLECIYGDEGCDYLYSKSVLLKPLPWEERLAELRDKITVFTKYKFSSTCRRE